MCMLRSWPIKIPNMNKMRQKTNDQLHTQDVRTDVWSNKHEKGYNSRKNQYNMLMLRHWPTKIHVPNMNKIQQKTNDQLRTQGLGMDERTDKGIPAYPSLCEWGYNERVKIPQE